MSKPDMVYIEPHTRMDGTYVEGHWRTVANDTVMDNLGTDIDGDGIAGFFDADADGDGIEEALDLDGDGIADAAIDFISEISEVLVEPLLF